MTMTMTMTMSRVRLALVAIATATVALPGAAAIGELGRAGGEARASARDPELGDTPYGGRFTFVRLRYADGGDFSFRRAPYWAHDYPRAERNLMKILESVTYIDPFMGLSGGNILTLDNPEFFQYPVAYMSEPGFWTLNGAEAEGLRSYLKKGGLVIFDDFRGSHWYNFEVQMGRVLPGISLVELDVSHPIFHSFFEIESLDFVQAYDQQLDAVFYGAFEDNDRSKRLLVIANYNNDIGEYWEFSDTGFVPIDLSNEAYKFGVNYFIYAFTH